MPPHERPDIDFPFLPGLYPCYWPWLMYVLLRLEWQTNPVCRRVWKKARAAALLMFLAGAMVGGIPIWEYLIYYSSAAPLVPMPVLFSIGIKILKPGAWVLFHSFPVAYGVWVYKRFFRNDPMLRNAPFSPAERFYSFLAPALLMISCYLIPKLVLDSFLSDYGLFFWIEWLNVDFSDISIVACSVFGFVGNLFLVLMGYLFVISILLRTMLLDRVTGRFNGHRFRFVILPIVMYLLIIWIANCLGSLAAQLVVLSPLSWVVETLTIPIALDGYLVIYAYLEMGQQFLVFTLVYAYFRHLWPKDTRLAFLEMFEAPESEKGAPDRESLSRS